MANRTKRIQYLAIGFLVVLILGSFMGLHLNKKSRSLSMIPKALEVKTVLYQKEDSWGWGPGGNETGLRIFKLPDHNAKQIEEKGAPYLDSLNFKYSTQNWEATPLYSDPRWKPNPKTGNWDINDYLCSDGFCVEVDQTVAEEVNAIINTAGNYFTHGPAGYWVISPNQRKVLVFFKK